MSRRTNIIPLAILLALALVPAGTASQRSPAAATSDVAQSAVTARLASESTPIVSPDAVDRMRELRAAQQETPITSPDAVDRAAAARADYGSNRRFDDRFDTPASVPAPEVVVSDDDTVWTHLGIGFTFGILLAGLMIVGLRLGHVRPLAHR